MVRTFVLTPSARVHRTLFEGDTLGASFFSKAKGVAKRGMSFHRRVQLKVWQKTVPKSIRKVFTRENFIKYAPILAGVAQVLNIIPGLGIAVSLAILAGSAALAAGTVAAKKSQQKTAQRHMDAKSAKEANAAFLESQEYILERYGMTYQQFQPLPLGKKIKFLQQVQNDAYGVSGLGADAPRDLEADAILKADRAFAAAQGYFTQKYDVTEAQFNAWPLEEKLNFLQVATEDAKEESDTGQPPFGDRPGHTQVEIENPAASGQPAAVKARSSGGTGAGTFFLIVFGLLALSRR